MAKPFTPNFRTPAEEQTKEERNKRESRLVGALPEEYRNEEPDVSWETEQLSKSYGVYLEFNRAKSGREKDWMYMIRIGVPSGGPITPSQWALLDDLAERYGKNPEGQASLRLTTRQAVQYHWVDKPGMLAIVKEAAESGLFSLNACGDNVRNVMACPLSRHTEIFNGALLGLELAGYFQLPSEPFIKIFAVDPAELANPNPGPGTFNKDRKRFEYGPQLLNRKFKIAVGALHPNPATGRIEPDNCVELRTNDLGIFPIFESGAVRRFQVYIGGGQGEKFGKPTGAMLSLPLTAVEEERLMPVLDAVVKVHQEWGDRQNRHWARLKYVVKAMGVDWYRARVAELVGFELPAPVADLDIGARHLHHGWTHQPNNGLYAYGVWLENGRVIDDSPNGRLRTMVREMAVKYRSPLHITANQDLLFTDIPDAAREEFEADLAGHGYGQRAGEPYSRLRMFSGACVGRDTCRLAYTDSEKFEPDLIDDLEKLGWGDLAESVGITGCERQCFRPGTKSVGLVGSGLNRYMLKLGGDEAGRHQGLPLMEGEQMFLKSIPRERVADVLDTLFHFYTANREDGEDLGAFNRRIGVADLLKHFRVHPKTADLLEKSVKHDVITA